MTIDESMDLDDARRMVDIWFDQVTPALNKVNDLAAQVACCVDDYLSGGSTWLEDNKQEFVKALNNARSLMYEIDNDELADHIATLERRVKVLSAEITELHTALGLRSGEAA